MTELPETPQWDIVTNVGLTALGVAASRAIETARADPLASDPFAAAFVRTANPPVPMPVTDAEAGDSVVWPALTAMMALRTRFLDDFFTASTPRQVVILAAGLDARAYRLAFPAGCRLFEIDQPKVLEFKQHVLDAQGARPTCERHAVPTDLRGDWSAELAAAGFDQHVPTTWLAEGLLPYLPPRAEEDLFDTVHKLSAPGSTLAAERPDPDTTTAMLDLPMVDELNRRFGVDLGSLWHSEPRRDPGQWLRWAGWETTEQTFLQVGKAFGRPLPDDIRAWLGNHVLVTARLPG